MVLQDLQSGSVEKCKCLVSMSDGPSVRAYTYKFDANMTGE